jgi:hypothetical protein
LVLALVGRGSEQLERRLGDGTQMRVHPKIEDVLALVTFCVLHGGTSVYAITADAGTPPATAQGKVELLRGLWPAPSSSAWHRTSQNCMLRGTPPPDSSLSRREWVSTLIRI